MYYGYDGLICQRDGDQGDTAQREGLNLCLNPSSERLALVKSKLKVSKGIYRRNSDPDHWGSNPNNLSRDQRAMLELAFAMNGDKQELSEAACYIGKRFGFHQNVHPGTDAAEGFRKVPDVVSPGELAVYIRGLDKWWLRPLLYVLDLGLLVDIKYRKKWDGANMGAINILYANQKYPTLVAKLAKKMCPWTDYKKEIINYYSDDNNGIPALGEMYCRTINNHLA